MDRKAAVEKARAFVVLARKVISCDRSYLFGSYVSGTPREESDLDIGIIVPRFEGDYFAVLKQLYVLRREVDLRIEPHLIIEDSDPLDFSHEVAQTGIRL